jgi:hypothetical protein
MYKIFRKNHMLALEGHLIKMAMADRELYGQMA